MPRTTRLPHLPCKSSRDGRAVSQCERSFHHSTHAGEGKRASAVSSRRRAPPTGGCAGPSSPPCRPPLRLDGRLARLVGPHAREPAARQEVPQVPEEIAHVAALLGLRWRLRLIVPLAPALPLTRARDAPGERAHDALARTLVPRAHVVGQARPHGSRASSSVLEETASTAPRLARTGDVSLRRARIARTSSSWPRSATMSVSGSSHSTLLESTRSANSSLPSTVGNAAASPSTSGAATEAKAGAGITGETVLRRWARDTTSER